MGSHIKQRQVRRWHKLWLRYFENLPMSRIDKHNFALEKIELAIPLLSQFDLDGLR